MIPTAISSSSTIRTRLHPARLLEMKRNRPAAAAWPASASAESAGHSWKRGHTSQPETFSAAVWCGVFVGGGTAGDRSAMGVAEPDHDLRRRDQHRAGLDVSEAIGRTAA